MAIKPRKALQRWKGPVTDCQAIIADKTHPLYEDTVSLTKQSLKAETEIYNIIKQARNGVVTHVNEYEGRYGDATAMDLQTSMELVKETNRWFGSLPVELRNHFENDPIKAVTMLDAVRAGDKTAIEEARKIGMIEKERKSENADPKATVPPGTPPTPPVGDNTPPPA
jgi:hypothetical protein